MWNRAEEKNGDYPTVAHISVEREVTVYDKDMPTTVIDRIKAVAQSPDTWAFGFKSLPGMLYEQSDGKKPSVLEKIREAAKAPMEPKKSNPKRNKQGPEL